MAKSKQLNDTVRKSPSQMSVESLSNDCYELLTSMKSDGDEAKEYSTRKRENKEKAIPLLRALRSKLNRQGKQDGLDGWTKWFTENKEDFGVSIRTVQRWLDPDDKPLKFANINNADGLKIGQENFFYTFKYNAAKTKIVGLILTPVSDTTKPLTKEEIKFARKLGTVTTHKMREDGKRTFCGKTKGLTLGMTSPTSPNPTCRNCQAGEQRHLASVTEMKQNADAVGYTYDEKTGVASPKITVVLSDCPVNSSEQGEN